MTARIAQVPAPANEPVRAYAPGDADRALVLAELDKQSAEVIEIPCLIGGEEVFTGNTVAIRNPSDHSHILANVHLAGPDEVNAAVDAAQAARAEWMALGWEDRAAVLLRAAALLAGPHRATVNAATMLAQGKTIYQAEIDAICELVDFWRFNVKYAADIVADQPPAHSEGVWNQLDYRPLDGFVFAIAPFNFSSIALNLCTAPALMGNTVVFKPTLQSMPSVWRMMKVLHEAGMPAGVINLVNGHGADVGDVVMARPELAGVHFTGSTKVFHGLWKQVANNLDLYRCYPRIVGETGGKDFIVAHPSADPQALSIAILRGSFEFQGQKCSAASRVYVPSNLWESVRNTVRTEMGNMKMGDVRDLSNFIGPVIDERAFRKHQEYLKVAADTAEIVAGGTSDDSTGWFITPTFVRVTDPKHRLMSEEIFGPIVTVYVYEPEDWEQTLDLVDTTSPYALTGALFARDRAVIAAASERLRFAAGNYYINDKPTGAVVGQQPFGGGRASGTNDKAGSPMNLLRWVSPRTIKETMVPATDWRYPFLD
ncbi:MAG: 1-pyrroline-5-carboxylate dehydrogenase [Myxococcota bacterium]|jgi:1-pyrroline-5-carboxylate dehydrogenase